MKIHTKTPFSCKMFFALGLQSNETIKKFILLLVSCKGNIAFLGFLISVSRKSRTIIIKTKCEVKKIKMKIWNFLCNKATISCFTQEKLQSYFINNVYAFSQKVL